jgi:tRNA A37 threonylcarbamoyladenosine dehydratase
MEATPGQQPEPDFERRFGGLRRLYGHDGAQRIFGAHVVVVGVGGVGSWAAEALARSGVAALTLVDMDHVAESNINRQVQACGTTLGMAKTEALAQRLRDIHPGCVLHLVDDFLSPENADRLLALAAGRTTGPFAVLDACDQVSAKTAVAAWARAGSHRLVSVGAAGGKCRAQSVEIDDLAHVTHDPLLAQLRYRLRRYHQGRRDGTMGVTCVFSRETVVRPAQVCEVDGQPDASLNCHGYGSVVTVTATFGMAAAGALLEGFAKNAEKIPRASKLRKMTL